MSTSDQTVTLGQHPVGEIPTRPIVEEVRFAVVMYGGIALCIYMSGITNVLFDMVISTARDHDSDEFLQTFDKLSDTQRVLRRAAQLHSSYRLKEVNQITSETPIKAVDCRFVIDILSGTSAGGLNNVFLAKALSNEESLTALANLWVNEGDIGDLLNDEHSSDPSRYITAENPPQSLLNSVRMQQRLLDAFQDMESLQLPNKNSVATSRLVDHLDLYITATDLKGLELNLHVKAGTPASERKNRAVFHLAYDPLAVPTVKGSDVTYRNDFRLVHIPFLSYISRATSCIVPAFEPIKLNDLDRLYYRDQSIKYEPKVDDLKFAHFFPDYNPHLFQDRFFGDGGYGDNYPFGPAIDQIRLRRTDVAVERILLYVEPDPEIRDDAPKQNEQESRPTFLEHVAAAFSVKSTEKIRDDVKTVDEQSLLLERIKYGLRAVSGKQEAQKHEENVPYNHLRETVVIDELTHLLYEAASVATLKVEDETVRIEERTIRWLIRGLHDVLSKDKTDLLKFFDYATVLRRVKFGIKLIDDILLKRELSPEEVKTQLERRRKLAGDEIFLKKEPNPDEIQTQLKIRHELAGIDILLKEKPTPDEIQTLLKLRRRLGGISLRFARIPMLIKLLTRGKTDKEYIGSLKAVIDQVDLLNSESTQKNPIDKIVRSIVALIPTLQLPELESEIKAALFGDAKRKLVAPHAVALRANSEFHTLQASTAELIDEVEGELIQFATNFKPFLVHPSQDIWSDFYAYDQAVLPLLYGIEGVESEWITLCRVSPLDSKTLIADATDAKNKLAGAGLGHFGGFFKDMWRVHDVLWGRLDSVENIVTKVIRQDNRARRELIFQGQLAVIKDFNIPLKADQNEIAPQSTMDTLRASLLRMAVKNYLRDIHRMPKDGSLDIAPYEKFLGQEPTSSLIMECTTLALARAGLRQWLASDLEKLASCKLTYEKAKIPPLTEIELTGRSLNVFEGMLETIKAKTKLGKALSIGGTILVTVAKILTPGSLQGSIYRHWLGLAVFFDAVLLACGLIWPGVMSFAIKATGATAVAAIVIQCLDIAVTEKKGVKAAIAALIAYLLAAVALWILFSGKVKQWVVAMGQGGQKPWYERLWTFFNSDLGFQWAMLSALTIVVYLTWLRLQKAKKVPMQDDKVVAIVSTLVLVAVGLGIPAALMLKESISIWVWIGAASCPVFLVFLILFGVFARTAPKTQTQDNLRKNLANAPKPPNDDNLSMKH
ncbi:MAG: patatin-like protein [Armatimonadota bacterium]